jgi:hypothetical protein
MFRYRMTGMLLPSLVLLALPALAAYPWRLPFGETLALPLVGVMTTYFCAQRYTGLLLAPVAFLAGLACDLFTRAPLGYWALLCVLAAICGGASSYYAQRLGPWFGWLCLLLMAPLSAALVWGLSSLYLWQLQDVALVRDGLVMALLLLPLPLVLLVGLEPLLTVRTD